MYIGTVSVYNAAYQETERDIALEESKKKKWNKLWLIPVLILAVAGIAVGIVYYRLDAQNEVRVEFSMLGDEVIAVEYGEKYKEPGVSAIAYGTVLFPEGKDISAKVRVTGSVNHEKLGKNIISYDLDYKGYSQHYERIVRVVDTQSPVITLVPDSDENIKPGEAYEEAGYTATDNYDGDITDRVVRVEKDGLFLYTVLDSSGNPGYVERNIYDFDTTPPVLTLKGGNKVKSTVGSLREDPGYTAEDDFAGDVTDRVEIIGNVNWFLPGIYELTYQVSDLAGNTSAASRLITMEAVEGEEPVMPTAKTIYLTFDDGPGPYTGKLLDTLKRYDVKATFFVTDSGYSETMKRIVNEGHSIGIHTMDHDYKKIYSSANAFYDDLLGMQQVIEDTTGVRTYLMRFPGGSSNVMSSVPGLMSLLSKSVIAAGFRYFDWNVDSKDASGAVSTGVIANNVTANCTGRKVCVVLQHDTHENSVAAVQRIILWGKRNGYTFQALDMTSPGMHHTVLN